MTSSLINFPTGIGEWGGCLCQNVISRAIYDKEINDISGPLPLFKMLFLTQTKQTQVDSISEPCTLEGNNIKNILRRYLYISLQAYTEEIILVVFLGYVVVTDILHTSRSHVRVSRRYGQFTNTWRIHALHVFIGVPPTYLNVMPKDKVAFSILHPISP